MSSREWVLLICLSALWGCSFSLIKLAVAEIPIFTLVLGRVVLAAAVLFLVVLAMGQRMPRTLRGWRPLVALGILNNMIPFSLIFWGQTQIASGLASILNATTPLFSVVLAHFLTRDESMTPNRVLGVVVGILAVSLMVGTDAWRGIDLNVLAQLAVLGAALSYALGAILGRSLREVPPPVAATGQMTASALLMLPITLWVDRPWQLPLPSPAAWAALIALGLASTALAYLIYFRLLKTAGVTNLLLVTFLIPITALLIGTFLLEERLFLRHFLGMGAVFVGLAAIDGRLLRRMVRT